MLKVYPAIFHREDGYWVEFPDLIGCQSCGSTIEETMEREGIDFVLDPLWNTIKPSLQEHVDGVISCTDNPKNKKQI